MASPLPAPKEKAAIRFFRQAKSFRAWLVKRHTSEQEIWVGFYKKDSGKIAMTYAEAVDESLCFGWIDGIRRSVDAVSYSNRFTPRRPHSNWSRINIKRVQELHQLGRMTPAGLQAFDARDPKRSGVYSFENKNQPLDATALRQFRSHREAWEFFTAQPPGYRRTVTWWVMSARQAATRERRLQSLIAASAAGRRAPPFERKNPASN